MEDFLEKFNIFDLLGLMFPGMVLIWLGIIWGNNFLHIWQNYDNEKYILFFVGSFLAGELLHELGTIIEKTIYKIIPKYDLRKMLCDGNNRVFKNNPIDFEVFCNLKDTIFNDIKINDISIFSNRSISNYIVSYCINYLEINKANGKEEKMMINSEMSRSFCLVGIIILIEQIIYFTHFQLQEFILRIMFLIIFILISYIRKRRYEEYRLRILIRTSAILIFDN